MKECFVCGDTLPQAYHLALETLFYQGEIVPCPAYNTTQKEVSMTMTVNHPLQEPRITRLAFLTYESLQQYCMEMLDGILDFEIEKGKWAYTYHQRISRSLDAAIEELKRDKWSRRAVVDVRAEEDVGNEDPACLQSIQFLIRKDKLDCCVLFRSNDALKATFMNCFALILIQERVAKELGIEVGTFTLRANSYHCYERDMKDLESYVKRFLTGGDTTYSFEDEWKEEMEACIPTILEKVEELKRNE